MRSIFFCLIFLAFSPGCGSNWISKSFPGKPISSMDMPNDFHTEVMDSEADLSCVFYSESRGRISVLATYQGNDYFNRYLEVIVNDFFVPYSQDVIAYKQTNSPFMDWEYLADSSEDFTKANFLYKSQDLWIWMSFDLKDSVDWKKILDSIELGSPSEDSEDN